MSGQPMSTFESKSQRSNPPDPANKNDPPESGSEELDPQATTYEDPYKLITSEKWYYVFLQIFVVFFITGGGSIGSGVILTHIVKDEAFIRIKDLYLLMPVLQSLKGNIDTCLGARLSTQANLGNLNQRSTLISQVVSNIALVQVQSIVGSLIVSVYSVALGAAVNRAWNFKHVLLLAMAATVTTCLTSLFIDIALITLIVLAYRFKINPDNIICPVAASAADLTTMVVFSNLIDSTFDMHHHQWWTFILILAAFIFAVLPIAVVYSLKLPETKTVLFNGWYVVLVALVFSSLGSLVLDVVVEKYRGYVLFQPVLNGATGNLSTILCTRLSTMLYQTSAMGTFHASVKTCTSPDKVWFRGTPQAACVRLLIAIGIPGQLAFVFLADYVYMNNSCLHVAFVLAYFLVSILHMLSLMYISHLTVHVMWKYKINPDNAAIPVVAAISDFFGSALLAAAFAILIVMQQEYLHGLFRTQM